MRCGEEFICGSEELRGDLEQTGRAAAASRNQLSKSGDFRSANTLHLQTQAFSSQDYSQMRKEPMMPKGRDIYKNKSTFPLIKASKVTIPQ